MDYSNRCAARPSTTICFHSDPQQNRSGRSVVHSSLVGVENHRRNEQAQQDGPHCRRQQSGRHPVEFLHLKPQHPVPNGITESTDQQHLLDGEYCQNRPLVTREERCGYEVAQRPVNQHRDEPAAGACDRTGTGLRTPQPFTRPILDISTGGSTQPRTKIVSINHIASLG